MAFSISIHSKKRWKRKSPCSAAEMVVGHGSRGHETRGVANATKLTHGSASHLLESRMMLIPEREGTENLIEREEREEPFGMSLTISR